MCRSKSNWPNFSLRRQVDLALLLISLLLAACSGSAGQQEVVPYTTRDRLLDQSGSADVSSPRICASGTNVYSVWHDSRRAGRSQVFFNAGRSGGELWGADQQLSDDPEGLESFAEHPSIACAGDSIYVVWEDDRDSQFGNRNIYFSYSDDAGRTWQEDQRITSDPEGDWDALSPQIVVDYDPSTSPDRTIYIAWYDGRSGAYDIYFTRSTNGYNFLSEELRLDTDVPGAAYSAHPRLASDGRGGLYVVWQDRRDGGNDVYSNRSQDGGYNWAASDVRLDGGVDVGASDAFGVQLTVDQEAAVPAVYAAWHDDRNGGKDIYFNYSLDAANTWQSAAIRLDTDVEGGSNSFYPALTAADGRVLVAWHDDRDLGYDIYLRRSEDGGESFGPPMRLDTDLVGSAHSLGVRLARDGNRVVAAWSDFRLGSDLETSPQPDLWYRASDDGGMSWSEPELRVDDDPQSTAISDELQVAVSGPFAHFLWVDYRLGRGDLWFRSMDSAGLAVP